MILSEIRSYLHTHRRASLADLAARFDSDPDALRGMLEKWVAKGRVRQLSDVAACGGSCGRCNPESAEVYEWTG
jgi:predicted ArsR family transcriptional regulator